MGPVAWELFATGSVLAWAGGAALIASIVKRRVRPAATGPVLGGFVSALSVVVGLSLALYSLNIQGTLGR